MAILSSLKHHRPDWALSTLPSLFYQNLSARGRRIHTWAIPAECCVATLQVLTRLYHVALIREARCALVRQSFLASLREAVWVLSIGLSTSMLLILQARPEAYISASSQPSI